MRQGGRRKLLYPDSEGKSQGPLPGGRELRHAVCDLRRQSLKTKNEGPRRKRLGPAIKAGRAKAVSRRKPLQTSCPAEAGKIGGRASTNILPRWGREDWRQAPKKILPRWGREDWARGPKKNMPRWARGRLGPGARNEL